MIVDLKKKSDLDVTIRMLPRNSYKTLFEMWHNPASWDDIDYIYAKDVDIDNVGDLTGRAFCAVDCFDYLGAPLTEDLEDRVLEVMAEDYKGMDFLAFDVLEVAEHSTEILRGTMCLYEYSRENRSVKRTPKELFVFIFSSKDV